MRNGSQVNAHNEAQPPLANNADTVGQRTQPEPPHYGQLIRDARKARGWERRDLARLYGEFFRDDRVSEDTIRMWEDYNKVPRSPKRRHVLAALLGIPPLLLGLEPFSKALPLLDDTIENALKEDHIDIAEYRRALIAYRRKHSAETAVDYVKKIRYRIYRLSENILFTKGQEKKQLERLMCGYLMCLGNIARDHQYFDIAIRYLNKAVELASEKNYRALHAATLIRRGGAYGDWGEFELTQGNARAANIYFTASVHDHDKALSFKPYLPPQMSGAVLAATSNTHARIAQDENDITEILKWMDEAEGLIGTDIGEENLDVGGYSYLLRLDKERFYQDKASAFLMPPTKELRSPSRVGESLAAIPVARDNSSARSQGYNMILQARAEFEMGNYPFATALASDALETLKGLHSDFNIARIATLHANLAHTSFGNSTAVAELSAQLLRVQQPELFNRA